MAMVIESQRDNEPIGSFAFSFVKPHFVRAGGVSLIRQTLSANKITIVGRVEKQLSARIVLSLYPQLYNMFPRRAHETETVLANTSGPAELMILWHQEDASSVLRKIIGKITSMDELPDGLRGMFAINLYRNVIHGSDNESVAQKEILSTCPELINEILINHKFANRFKMFLDKY